MVRIACVGIAVQDRIYRMEHFPSEGRKYIASDYFEAGGGPAATAAVAVARLGGSVDFIGRVGDDPVGQTILKELQDEGVSTDKARVFTNARSFQAAIIVNGAGERMIVNYPSPDLPMAADWLNDIDFSVYDMVLADVRWHPGSVAALSAARRASVPTMLDADTTPQDIRDLVQLADHAVFSAPGLRKTAGEDEYGKGLLRAAKITSGRVYVTAGEEGCYWLDDSAVQHLPGYAVDVVDTTGAGDVFHGALALTLAHRMPVQDAVGFANAVAALKCTRLGGRAGIPTWRRAEEFLAQTPVSDGVL